MTPTSPRTGHPPPPLQQQTLPPVWTAPPPTNALGTAALVCSVVGFFTCGLLCPLGAVLGFCAAFSAPRGRAVTGAILGTLGTLLWLGTLLALLGVSVSV